MRTARKATVQQGCLRRDRVPDLGIGPEPRERRKQMGVKAVLFLSLLTGLTYAVKKRLWKDVH